MTAAGRAAWTGKIDAKLALVGLADSADRPVRTYSQGMRQRLGLARALLGDPEVLLLDEPTNGLDPQGVRWLRQLIRELHDKGVTVLISSHMLAELQLLATRVLMLSAGEVVADLDAAHIDARTGALEAEYFKLLR
jgi:ABC-2 type transport system ATP-binding protein